MFTVTVCLRVLWMGRVGSDEYTGTAICRSPKQARRLALRRAFQASQRAGYNWAMTRYEVLADGSLHRLPEIVAKWQRP